MSENNTEDWRSRNWSEWAHIHGGIQALVDTIHDLHRQLESMRLQRDSYYELFRKTVNKDNAEWRAIIKKDGKWYVSPHVFPGMTRESAIEIANLDRNRYEDARPQIRVCSDWTDAEECMKSKGGEA